MIEVSSIVKSLKDTFDKKPWLLLIATAIILSLGYILILHLPIVHSIYKLDENIKKLNAEIRDTGLQITILKELESRLPELTQINSALKRRVTLKRAKFYLEGEPTYILKDITKISVIDRIESFTFSEIAKQDQKEYAVNYYQLNFQTGFKKLIRFLDRLEGISSTLSVDEIKVDSNREIFPNLNVQLKIAILGLKE